MRLEGCWRAPCPLPILRDGAARLLRMRTWLPQHASRLLQRLDQARGVPAAAAALLHAGIELVDQRDYRHRRLPALALGHGDAEILAHPVDGEAVVELAGDHVLPAVV